MEDQRNSKFRDEASIVGGLLLVGGGIVLLMRNLGYIDLPHWLFTWPVILILVGVYSGFKHNFSNTGWIIMIAIGGFFLLDKAVPNIRLEPAFWPAVIIAAGILFMIRPRKKNRENNWGRRDRHNIESLKAEYNVSSAASGDKTDFIKMDSVFSGVNKSILSKNFQGGKISCVFGGAEVDLLQADINGNVLLKIEVVFGGVKLLVPSNWTIHSEIDGAFRNVEDKRKYNPGVMVDPGKVLILKGSVVFGGIEIKSY
jgi:predicted membrane protein